MRLWLAALLFGLSFAATSSMAQSSLPMPLGVHRAQHFEDTHPMDTAPPEPRRTINLAKLKHDASELAELAGSVPPDVEQTTKGVLPKDLAAKLKRIEKLAKQLRGQLTP